MSIPYVLKVFSKTLWNLYWTTSNFLPLVSTYAHRIYVWHWILVDKKVHRWESRQARGPPWLWNSKKTSPEVQNRGVSVPKKRLRSSNVFQKNMCFFTPPYHVDSMYMSDRILELHTSIAILAMCALVTHNMGHHTRIILNTLRDLDLHCRKIVEYSLGAAYKKKFNFFFTCSF